ncbi:DUF6095 family protein [Flavobacteriales bacterium]|jgi:hypothetical protein|nr:DUF6095 family protein [Flavobacteriales bacterium]MDB2362592.1 DUF6095 family protein [Flavobacteriales bacterium]MDG1189787.1 DUF6095 family protein [Flavobacteriales bacterium]
MDKQKLSNGMIWISMSIFFIFTAAVTLFIGNSKGSLALQALGVFFILCLFFFAYKGLKTILDAFFDKKK